MFLDTEFLKTEEIILKLDHTVEGKDDWLPAYHFKICLPDGTQAGVCDLRIGHNEGVYCEYAGGVLEGVVDVPEDNDMYQRGERKKCIYRFVL